MRGGMCKGCMNLAERIQVQHYEGDNTTLRVKPLRTIKPYCREYELHLEFVEQIVKGNSECKRYFE